MLFFFYGLSKKFETLKRIRVQNPTRAPTLRALRGGFSSDALTISLSLYIRGAGNKLSSRPLASLPPSSLSTNQINYRIGGSPGQGQFNRHTTNHTYSRLALSFNPAYHPLPTREILVRDYITGFLCVLRLLIARKHTSMRSTSFVCPFRAESGSKKSQTPNVPILARARLRTNKGDVEGLARSP